MELRHVINYKNYSLKFGNAFNKRIMNIIIFYIRMFVCELIAEDLWKKTF